MTHVEEGRLQDFTAAKLVSVAEHGSLPTRWLRKAWILAWRRLPEEMRVEIRDRVWWCVPEKLRKLWRRER